MSKGMMLPGELTSLLGMLGFSWPEGQEGTLFDMGGHWMGFTDKLGPTVGEADGHAQGVWSGNKDVAVDQFRANWSGRESAKQNLEDGSTAATLIGAGLYVCAGVVIALKISVVIQLIILAIQVAQAIATAFVTFGASLLEIPIFKIITKILLDQVLNLAIMAILGG
ncbi:WXG100-like domain-containing protein [Longispora urticae]